jgi:hypothetical protein
MALEWLTGSTYYKFSNEHEKPSRYTLKTANTMYLFRTCSMCQSMQEHPQGDIYTYIHTYAHTRTQQYAVYILIHSQYSRSEASHTPLFTVIPHIKTHIF